VAAAHSCTRGTAAPTAQNLAPAAARVMSWPQLRAPCYRPLQASARQTSAGEHSHPVPCLQPARLHPAVLRNIQHYYHSTTAGCIAVGVNTHAALLTCSLLSCISSSSHRCCSCCCCATPPPTNAWPWPRATPPCCCCCWLAAAASAALICLRASIKASSDSARACRASSRLV
jgi:hypothetical protein